MGAMLRIVGVSKRFGGVNALNNVTLDVGRGEVLGLVGPNGSGKTTLINCISGTLRPNTGSITLDQDPIAKLPSHRIARLGVARTYQTVRLFGGLTVVENVEMRSLQSHPRQFARAQALGVLDEVGLLHLANVAPGQLSLAEHRKVELARAVASEAKIILLDEVMAGLTKAESQATGDIVHRLSRERLISFIIVEHVMASLLPLVDRLVVMDQGSILMDGPPEEVMASQVAVDAYFGTV
jgi:ABC-type branched-subunit amino acid transport system ATPase component